VSARRTVEARAPGGLVCCGECATVHDAAACPECGEAPDGALVGVLRTEITTEGGARWLVTAERDPDGGGWVPAVRQAPGSLFAADATEEAW
jgi:hypothetical protein